MSIKQNTMTPNKLDKSAVDLILPRLQDEYNAFYFYRSASNFLQNMGYVFAAEYFAGESTDELSHAKGLEDYLVSWNVTPNLPDIDKPVLKFDGLTRRQQERCLQLTYVLLLSCKNTLQYN